MPTAVLDELLLHQPTQCHRAAEAKGAERLSAQSGSSSPSFCCSSAPFGWSRCPRSKACFRRPTRTGYLDSTSRFLITNPSNWWLLMLTINSLGFDYRHIDGDAAFGTRTIPVRLRRKNTIYLLIGLWQLTHSSKKAPFRECSSETGEPLRF